MQGNPRQEFGSKLTNEDMKTSLNSINQVVSRQNNIAQYHIGNAQNLLVRNILARLQAGTFSEREWQATKLKFGNCCAYCGSDRDITKDHVIAINREKLGEDHIGNLVPCCKPCNGKKGDIDFRRFLAHDSGRLAAIERHMAFWNYVPIGETNNARQVREILATARAEVDATAEKSLKMINELLARH